MNTNRSLIRPCQIPGQEPSAVLTAVGEKHAETVADVLGDALIEHIVSSAFVRAVPFITSLAPACVCRSRQTLA
jgi:broad specificity phosphatase PhoE